MSDKIVVTSATGTVGTEVVMQLAAINASVVALTHRNGNAAKNEKLPPGVVPVGVDFNDPTSLTDALQGAGKLMLISPYAANQIELARTVVEAAKAAGVGHMVVLSGYNVEDKPERIAIGQTLYEQEQLVLGSGIPCTFLRACSFMQNFINYYPPQPDGNLYMPVGEAKMNFVDVRDIARVAVLVLTEPGHENKIYRLATVSHSITEIAQTLSQVTGRPYRYVDVPPAAVQAGMEQYGVPNWMITQNLELYAAVKSGRYTQTSPDFMTVTGRQPTDLATFFTDYRAAFAG